jgi:hypothetical protein
LSGKGGSRSVPRDEDVALELVEYLIVAVPNPQSLGTLAPALAQLADSGTMRLLDSVVVSRERDGAVNVVELEAVEGAARLAESCGLIGELLSERDIELASVALAPSSAALVLVIEDRWATPLAAAIARAGGRIVSGERIPAARVEAVLADGRIGSASEG